MGRFLIQIEEAVQAWTPDQTPIEFRTHHEALILGAFALASPDDLKRQELAEALWPGSGAEKAQQNLRQRLQDLRRWLGKSLEADRTHARLVPGSFSLVQTKVSQEEPSPIQLDCRRLVDASLEESDSSDHFLKERHLRSRAMEIVIGNPPLIPLTTSQYRTLLMRISDKHVALESRLVAAVCYAQSPGAFQHRQAILKLMDETRYECTEPGSESLCWMTYLHRRCAELCHHLGLWHDSLLHEKQCVRLADLAGLYEIAQWGRFRAIRKQIDVQLRPELPQKLYEMSVSPVTPSHLRAFIDMNLVHGFLSVGAKMQAAEAADRCRKELGSGGKTLFSWLMLNEALFLYRVGQFGPAQERLRLAATDILNEDPSYFVWHYSLASEVFAASGQLSRAAICASLHEAWLEHAKLRPTPTNARRYQAVLQHCTRSIAPSDWFKFSAPAREIPIGFAPQLYAEQIGL